MGGGGGVEGVERDDESVISRTTSSSAAATASPPSPAEDMSGRRASFWAACFAYGLDENSTLRAGPGLESRSATFRPRGQGQLRSRLKDPFGDLG